MQSIPIVLIPVHQRLPAINMAPAAWERKYLLLTEQRTQDMAKALIETKRKATDGPDDPTSTKRIKNSLTESPERDKKPLKVIPFPEKVRWPT